MRVDIDVTLRPGRVTQSYGVTDGERALFKMLDIIVKTIREAIGKLPFPRKRRAGVTRTVPAKYQISVVDPLVTFGLAKIDSLEIINRFCCAFNIGNVAIAACVAPHVPMRSTCAKRAFRE